MGMASTSSQISRKTVSKRQPHVLRFFQQCCNPGAPGALIVLDAQRSRLTGHLSMPSHGTFRVTAWEGNAEGKGPAKLAPALCRADA